MTDQRDLDFYSIKRGRHDLRNGMSFVRQQTMHIKLKKTPKAGRTPEQIRRHYEVEKRLARKLKETQSREDRKTLYRTMYDKLFEEVPDHPRLQGLRSRIDERRVILSKSTCVERFLDKSATIVEFGPGDCNFLLSICDRVKKAYGVDISDQRDLSKKTPSNFELIVYDGYDPKIEAASADLVFSDQLIEHIHPDDIQDHFRMVKQILRPGGRYVFRTPHRFSGPHDVSGFFSDDAEGFHLCEWTYFDLKRIVSACGYSRWESYWCAKRIFAKIPVCVFCLLESILDRLPKRLKKMATRVLLPSITAAAIK